MNVFVTGASGFVGSELCNVLYNRGYSIRCAVREYIGSESNIIAVGDIGPHTDWSEALKGVDVVVHLAARVHIMNESSEDPLEAFRIVNVEGTRRLAEQSAQFGIRRLVFVSSIKVNGELTGTKNNVSPFTSLDPAQPKDAYGQSKWEAEQALQKIAASTGLEVVVIRPPLVYGPGVKANFLNMMRWLNKGLPLPFGAVHNRRSLVALDNLLDLIVTCIDNPAAANQTFLVSDGEDLSTTELLQRMAAALGKPAHLLPVYAGLLRVGGVLLGKRDIAQRLLDSLQVDINKTREVLSWSPPVSVDEALKKTAKDFLAREEY